MKVIPILALVAVAACEPVPFQTSAAGQLASGSPVSGVLEVSGDPRRFRFQVISPSGWQCEGTHVSTGDQTTVVQVPLACTNGATGNLIATLNVFADQIAASFSLSNGQSGQVVFGST